MGVACDLTDDAPPCDDGEGKRGMCRAFTPMSHWEQTPWHPVCWAVSVTGVECIRASSRNLPPCRPWQVSGVQWEGGVARHRSSGSRCSIWQMSSGVHRMVWIVSFWQRGPQRMRHSGRMAGEEAVLSAKLPCDLRNVRRNSRTIAPHATLPPQGTPPRYSPQNRPSCSASRVVLAA